MMMETDDECVVPPCHVPGCRLTVDVVIKTSDAKYFGAHLQNLQNHADGFPPASFGKRKRMNHMDIEEDSEVTSLMLDFMHKQPQPDLRDVPVGRLVDFAEAAEKYLIYSAMGTCRLVMGTQAWALPLTALAYAIKHEYPEVADRAAPHSIGMDWKDVHKELGPTGAVLWGQYRESFLALFRNRGFRSVQFHPDGQAPVCQEILDIQLSTLSFLFGAPEDIVDEYWVGLEMAKVSVHNVCFTCREGWRKWLQELADEAKALPKFSTLL
ncbi:hypothetical protein BDN72DRAFT_838589 [Pluteus cervinus]|uniref:Uncharacterized protein n=1 Tax=Pluteus cervinus TaxID=181527 RepID=A0ACD3B0J8_9AGAR|nr:hypothetical protein BDN72DRAFT_838589 [Pluteus cervinus]